MVCTKASSGDILYTPASSAVSKPMSTFGSDCLGNFPSIESSAAGLSLDAQPADFTDAVRRIGASAFMGLFHGRRLDSWKFDSTETPVNQIVDEFVRAQTPSLVRFK